MPVYLNPPSRNPVAQIIGAIVGVLVMIGAFMLGLVALAVIAGLILIFTIVAWFRTRHLRKHLKEEAQATRKQRRKSDTIEAEYTVISTIRNGERRPD